MFLFYFDYLDYIYSKGRSCQCKINSVLEKLVHWTVEYIEHFLRFTNFYHFSLTDFAVHIQFLRK